VPHRRLDAVAVDGAGRTRVLEARRLLHGVRVHVGAVHDRRAVAVPQYSDDARLGDARDDVETQPSELVGNDPRGSVLLEAELGVAVEVLEGLD
jgi:hypothetical protein